MSTSTAPRAPLVPVPRADPAAGACLLLGGVHLLSALGAEAIADGQQTSAYRLQALNETVIDASWGLAIAPLAVAGGLSRTLVNPITLPLGLVGGLAFAAASGTIAYTDRFDGLFPVGSLIGVWGLVVGLMVLLRRHAGPVNGADAGRMGVHRTDVAADAAACTAEEPMKRHLARPWPPLWRSPSSPAGVTTPPPRPALWRQPASPHSCATASGAASSPRRRRRAWGI